MKKLFSIFFVLALMWSGNTMAQLIAIPDGVIIRDVDMSIIQSDIQKMESLCIDSTSPALHRHNAPMADPSPKSLSFAWNDAVTAGCSYFGTSGAYKVYRYQFLSQVLLFFVFNDTSAPEYTFNELTLKMPLNDNYSIGTGKGDKTIFGYPVTYNGETKYSMTTADAQFWALYSGTISVEEGADGPYIHGSNMKITGGNTDSRGRYITYSGYSLTIGSAATYSTVTVQSDNTTMGTVSYSMKSGYVYNIDGSSVKHFKNGSTYTLTAHANEGFRFVNWKKGNTVISTYPSSEIDVRIDGNADYTATFECISCSRGTITAVTSPIDGGTVTVSHSGEQPGGTSVTLTATANSDFEFQRWNDGNTENPRTVIVDGDVPYTAFFVDKTYDYTNHFYWNTDYATDGTLYMFTNGNKSALIRVGAIKDKVSNSMATNPAVQLDFVVNQGPDSNADEYLAEGGFLICSHDYYTPYYGTWDKVYTNNSRISNDDYLGYIVSNASIGSRNNDKVTAQSYYKPDRSNTLYFQSGKVKILDGSVDNHPYFYVDMVSTNGSTILVEIGNAPVYTISYKDMGDETFSGTHGAGYPTFHTYGVRTSLVNPTKPNAEFLGWYTNSDCSGTPITLISHTQIEANVTLYAKWEEEEVVGNTVTLTSEVGANGSIIVHNDDRNTNIKFTNGQAVIAENTNITITASGNTGYKLSTLTFGGEAIESGASFVVDNDYTITATFEPYHYAIAYKDKSNQTFSGVFGANTPTQHTYGTPTALVSPTKENMTFGGWYENSACTGSAVTSIAATAKTADFTLYAKWRGTITATASGSGSVSGAGTYDVGANVSLTATPSNSNYYLYDWEKDGVSLGVRTNPLVQSVTANAAYTAVFSDREVVNITASDDMDLTSGGSYWSVSGAGTDGSSNNYTMNIRFDSGNLTGTFNSGVNTSNTWVQKAGGSKVYAQSISVATVTEPTTGNLHIVATIIGTDEKKYVITGDYTKPIVGSWANFSWDNPNHHIVTGVQNSTGVQCDAQWSPMTNPFLYIQAYDDNYYTNNYVRIFMATNLSNTYKGYNNEDIVGPVKGKTYTFYTPAKVTVSEPCYKDMWGSNMTLYRWSYTSEKGVPMMIDGTGYWDGFNYIGVLGVCNQSSWLGTTDGSNLTINENESYWIKDNYYVITTAGKNGQPFVRLYNKSNQLLIVIGAPAPNRRVTIANPGAGKSITITDGTNNYATGTTHSIAEGTTLTISVSTTDGTHVTGWTGTGSSAVTGSDGSYSLTVGAQNYNIAAEFASSSDITLCENCNDAHYNTFKTNYNNKKVNVTYNRQFAEGRWSTMCLPFSLDLAAMITHKMSGCVYEFKYATGNANVGSGVNLYFSNAKSIEAGKCYIVNANAELAAKTSFVFSGVTIDVSADNVKLLNSLTAYNGLAGYKTKGDIELVGTLRNGTLHGTTTGNTYMGLKGNKIYYPNIETGSTIWAYRGIFRSTSALNIEKMRIVVDGEDRGELIIDADGELLNASGDAPSRKFIRDGVLYIEREGVIYDAQGKRVEN